MPYLQVAAVSELEPLASTPTPPPGEGPEWDEARSEGCESPLELRLLRAIRAAGLPEPRSSTRSMIRGADCLRGRTSHTSRRRRILIYADGLEFHSGLRQRIHDTRQSNQLQTEGWQVLRFLGPHVHRNPADCVSQLQKALDLQQP